MTRISDKSTKKLSLRRFLTEVTKTLLWQKGKSLRHPTD